MDATDTDREPIRAHVLDLDNLLKHDPITRSQTLVSELRCVLGDYLVAIWKVSRNDDSTICRTLHSPFQGEQVKAGLSDNVVMSLGLQVAGIGSLQCLSELDNVTLVEGGCGAAMVIRGKEMLSIVASSLDHDAIIVVAAYCAGEKGSCDLSVSVKPSIQHSFETSTPS